MPVLYCDTFARSEESTRTEVKTMDELVKVVAQKTGLSQEQAKAAAQAVIDFLKTKLPAPVAGQIDNVLKDGSGFGNVAKGLGGMLGKK